jgi:hypothetical protein
MKVENITKTQTTPDRSTAEASVPNPRERGSYLRAVAGFQTEVFRVMAGFLPSIGNWDLRRQLSGEIFRDARRVQDVCGRSRELAAGGKGLHLSLGVAGWPLIEALCGAPDGGTAFRAVFGLVKPRLCGLLEAYLRDDLRVFDAPSMPVVEAMIAELKRQTEWAAGLPEGAADAGDSAWLDDFAKRLDELPELIAAGEARAARQVKTGRRIGNLPVMHPARPDGFAAGVARTALRDSDAYADRELFHAHNFMLEIQAADSCATLLFEAPDMPWEFYFDVARHMWDETRHCEFGEIKLRGLGRDIRELGVIDTAYVMRQTIDPIDRYAALTTQEADAFPGKHAGLKDAIEHGDELMARAWSYDISDETQHVRYGHKWIPVMIETVGEPRSYDQIKHDAENWRRDVLAPAYAARAAELDNPS